MKNNCDICNNIFCKNILKGLDIFLKYFLISIIILCNCFLYIVFMIM